MDEAEALANAGFKTIADMKAKLNVRDEVEVSWNETTQTWVAIKPPDPSDLVVHFDVPSEEG